MARYGKKSTLEKVLVLPALASLGVILIGGSTRASITLTEFTSDDGSKLTDIVTNCQNPTLIEKCGICGKDLGRRRDRWVRCDKCKGCTKDWTARNPLASIPCLTCRTARISTKFARLGTYPDLKCRSSIYTFASVY